MHHLAAGQLDDDAAQDGHEQVLGVRAVLLMLHRQDVLPPLMAVRLYIRVILAAVLDAGRHQVGQHLLSCSQAAHQQCWTVHCSCAAIDDPICCCLEQHVAYEGAVQILLLGEPETESSSSEHDRARHAYKLKGPAEQAAEKNVLPWQYGTSAHWNLGCWPNIKL